MFSEYKLNIFDFDIYSRRISFFYNKRDELGTTLGLVLTFLYAIMTLIIFIIYSIKTIRRTDVKAHESTVYSMGLPSIDINPNLFYIAFGLENPVSLNKYLDERIYYPKVTYIKKEKINGVEITRESISLDVERCQVQKFGDNYKKLFSPGELNNSYCLKDFNLTLFGGSKYNQSSYIQITIHPCINNTENNNYCKSQTIIDSHLTSAYFSIIIKDIGLNPLNYSYPMIPTIQSLKTNVDISICRESFISLGITEIDTDEGLFINSIRKEYYLNYRKYSQSFYFINNNEYLQGHEVFAGQIYLEDNILLQKREYTKMSEVLSVTGGYMQLISTFFICINLFTKNISVEKKILNQLFNFNIKQKKIVLNIQYEKKLNCCIRNEKGNINAFIPFFAKKKINHGKKIINFKLNDHSSRNDLSPSSNNNTFYNFNSKKKINTFNLAKKHYSDKNLSNNISNLNNKKRPIYIEQNIINRSKMIMLFKDDFKDEEINSQINKMCGKKKFMKNSNNKNYIIDNNENNNHSNELKTIENETINEVSFNFADYFCCLRIRKNNDENVRVFNFGINFYRNQMNIINFFNIFFLTEIMLTQFIYKKSNILNQIIDIPLR